MYKSSCTLSSVAFLALVALTSAQYSFNNKAKVISWSRIDIDVKEVEEGFDDGNYLNVVRPIYEKGKWAKPRTLQKLSTTAGSVMGKESTFKLFQSYWKSPKYANIAVSQIIRKKGPYARSSQLFRADAGIKTIQYFSVWMWVIHEMEVAVRRCNAGKKPISIMQWDYAAADYQGSQIIKDEGNVGYLLHTLAVKRCSQFGTCVDVKGVTRAKVNNKIYFNFRIGKGALRRGQCAKAKEHKDKIIQLMYVPLVQGCVRYIVKTKMDRGAAKQKSHGEAWAFCAAFLPKLNSCSKRAARVVRQNLGPAVSRPMSATAISVLKEIYGQFKCMGINCVDFGNYDEFPELNIPRCSN